MKKLIRSSTNLTNQKLRSRGFKCQTTLNTRSNRDELGFNRTKRTRYIKCDFETNLKDQDHFLAVLVDVPDTPYSIEQVAKDNYQIVFTDTLERVKNTPHCDSVETGFSVIANQLIHRLGLKMDKKIKDQGF